MVGLVVAQSGKRLVAAACSGASWGRLPVGIGRAEAGGRGHAHARQGQRALVAVDRRALGA